MADTLIGADLDLALDVLLDLPAEVTFDLVTLIDEAADAGHLVVGQLPDLRAGVDPGGLADLGGAAALESSHREKGWQHARP